jgi:hypothetical protein
VKVTPVAIPLSESAASVFALPATIAYEPEPIDTTVFAGKFEPVSASTANVWGAGTVSCAAHVIVHPVPVPVEALHVVVCPAVVAAPSMNSATCFVDAETNAGLRLVLVAVDPGLPMSNVPLTDCVVTPGPGVTTGAGELPFDPPPPHEASSMAVAMHAKVVSFIGWSPLTAMT